MSEQRHPITVLLNDFITQYIPKIDQLEGMEKVVAARLMKAALEKYIEENS